MNDKQKEREKNKKSTLVEFIHHLHISSLSRPLPLLCHSRHIRIDVDCMDHVDSLFVCKGSEGRTEDES